MLYFSKNFVGEEGKHRVLLREADAPGEAQETSAGQLHRLRGLSSSLCGEDFQ
jgi:hypothetical protein